MNRKALRAHTHNRKNVLTLNNPNYKQWVFRYTFLELEKDLGQFGDITSNTLIDNDKKCVAKIVCNEEGILAGMNELIYFLQDSDPKFKPSLKSHFDLDTHFEDGQNVSDGETVLIVESTVSSILAIERVALNLLGRMSGVATETANFIKLISGSDVLITPTRKTLWGLLDKKATVLGGGGSHRLDLSDSIIVKDNHLRVLDDDFAKVFHAFHVKKPDVRFIEVEVENKDQAIRVAKYFNEFSKAVNSVPVIMFDNMSPEDIKNTIMQVKDISLYNGVLFEASGGIDRDNIIEYSNCGVDIISIGALTQSATSLDFTLKIE
ncbi:carboxylating nicotinate-nucleotide diphosphorylase [Candidatus Peregrinibacteria bacterium]|nr:carboxylating nicotinate-nucleotide diphosphorylase [Candidatus Peregrinibacteria bacterium]